jgi:sec-independent protein translocase protein TatA
MGIGWTEILILGLIVVIIFGASQIPKIARSLGEGMREFKKAIKEVKDDKDKDGEAETKTKTKTKLKMKSVKNRKKKK